MKYLPSVKAGTTARRREGLFVGMSRSGGGSLSTDLQLTSTEQSQKLKT